ncbi:MAG: hypothetical protein SPL39_08365 [Selenomonadaceae bacterium]|nr:hypothetical protein [Selenomonadaceae bacterium]
MAKDRAKLRRRAENVVWTAAGQYGFLPAFLAFHRDGSPDGYLNAIVGFSYRFYDGKKLSDWLEGLERSAFSETFSDVAWMGIETAVYPRGLEVAPGLAALRLSHARRFLADAKAVDVSMQERMMTAGVVESLKKARCRAVLGEAPGLRNPWDIGLYRALELPPFATTEELTEALDAVLRRFFVLRWDTGVRRAFHFVLPEVVHAMMRRLLPMTQVQEDTPVRQGQEARHGVLGGRDLGSVLVGEHADAWRKVCAEAGPPAMPEEVRARIEEDVCRGGHAGRHIYFAKMGGSREDASAKQGWQRNVAWAAAHAGAILRARKRLLAELSNVLEVVRQPLLVAAKRGRFSATRAWRAGALQDARVFSAVEDVREAQLDVLVLLDASASREAQQPQIAAEAAVLAEVLVALGVPVQVWSYASLDGVTVLTELKGRSEARTDGVYGYRARGWNRDGLALRAVGALVTGKGALRQVVLMLTDAHPGDALGLSREGAVVSRSYMGDAAVADAADAARELRGRGVRLVGLVESVFPGEETDGAARRVFGSHFVRVRGVEMLAKKGARVIAEELGRR